MCNRDDSPPARRRRAPAWLLAVCGVPLAAIAGNVDLDRRAAVPPPAPAAAPAEGFQLRCWQDGELLFEQRHVEISAETVAGLKLRGRDRRGQPVLLTDTGNATCLIRRDPVPARR